jgi:Clathrin adaptor complex small chain
VGAAALSYACAPAVGSRGNAMIHFFLLFSRQGKVRLTKYYSTFTQKERNKVRRCATDLLGACVASATCEARDDVPTPISHPLLAAPRRVSLRCLSRS